MKKQRYVLSIPGDTLYLRAQVDAAKVTADRLGVDLEVVSAEMDSVTQGQQLLNLAQSRAESRPEGIVVEPVSASGLPRVAEAAVAAGIGWVVSNAQVDYVGTLRKASNVPVFVVSQDHLEIGRIQGRQIAAILPEGGTVLYLRGPAMSWWATKRFEGVESVRPRNIQVKSLKVQASTAENAYKAVSSWLTLSHARPESTQLIMSQNVDFLISATKAFEMNTPESERAKWRALPRAGAGIASQVRPLVDKGELTVAVVTSLTLDKAVDMLVRAMAEGRQPPEQTLVEAYSYPNLEELAKKRRTRKA